MIVHIKAFANFREILGRDIQVELDEGSKSWSSWIAFAYLNKDRNLPYSMGPERFESFLFS
jgi:hypothetical protein